LTTGDRVEAVAHFDSRQSHLYGGKLLYEIVVVCSKGRYSVKKDLSCRAFT